MKFSAFLLLELPSSIIFTDLPEIKLWSGSLHFLDDKINLFVIASLIGKVVL